MNHYNPYIYDYSMKPKEQERFTLPPLIANTNSRKIQYGFSRKSRVSKRGEFSLKIMNSSQIVQSDHRHYTSISCSQGTKLTTEPGNLIFVSKKKPITSNVYSSSKLEF